jgi:hypothetical protein
MQHSDVVTFCAELIPEHHSHVAVSKVKLAMTQQVGQI